VTFISIVALATFVIAKALRQHRVEVNPFREILIFIQVYRRRAYYKSSKRGLSCKGTCPITFGTYDWCPVGKGPGGDGTKETNPDWRVRAARIVLRGQWELCQERDIRTAVSRNRAGLFKSGLGFG
jgi:hypothetical protein